MEAVSGTEVKQVYVGLAMARDHLAKEGLGKNQTNQHQGFKFRGIDDLYGILQPALAHAQIVMTPSIVAVDRKEFTTDKGKIQFSTTVEVEYLFTSLVDGSEAFYEYAGEASDTGDKSLSKALTMAFKSFCFHAFQIPLNGNDDADKHVAEEVSALTPALKQDLEMAADGGLESLRDAWKKLGKEERKAAQADTKWYDGLKATAESVKSAA